MTDGSPRRFGIAVIVIAVHVTLLALLLRSVVSVAPPPTAEIELANIAARPPAPPTPPATVAATPAKSATPAPLPAAPPPVAATATAAPSAPIGNGATGAAAIGGGTGNGSGSGGGIVRARWASGSISNRDYPKAASAAGVGGAVTVHFDVRTDGGVENCRVVASSGSTLLDETTCELIEARFRYVPARDATGTAITDITGWRQDWWIGAPKQ